MSIFGKIKSAIFGQGGPWSEGYLGNKHPGADKPATAQPTRAPEPHVTPTVQSGNAGQARATPHPQTTQGEPTSGQAAGVAAATQPAQPVDVEAVLEEKARHAGQSLNWRSSIVDLLKLLDIDSSLSARKELAEELGYTGARDGSAEMNIWLHKAVMRALEQNGGKVPANLRD